MLSEKLIEGLEQAMLEWDKAFIASPNAKRCLCIPFNDELNKLYDQYIITEEAFTTIGFALLKRQKKILR